MNIIHADTTHDLKEMSKLMRCMYNAGSNMELSSACVHLLALWKYINTCIISFGAWQCTGMYSVIIYAMGRGTVLTLCIQMYSPNLVSNVPFCSILSFRVSLGPSSCSPTLSSSRNIYLHPQKVTPLQILPTSAKSKTNNYKEN